VKRKILEYSSLIASVAFVTVFFGAAILKTPGSTAVSATDFKAGNIIDDAVFYNKNAMTVEEIQAHLNRYMPACDTWGTGAVGSGRYINGQAVPANTTRADYARQMREAGNTRYHEPPYVCVQNFYENPETHETLYDTKNEIKEGMLSAAQIIYNAAQKYGVNPQVLLVMLRKESYVWGDNWPLKDEYNTVMGYACPDNAPCDTKYFGFYNQVETAAWQLNYYKEHIYSYNYRPYATNYILYSPTVSCGRKEVYLENIATTSLYIYTPYTPNDAALRNYPGTATCGSYGNRNFFMYFSEWFGSTHSFVAEKKVIPDGKYRLLNAAYDFTHNADDSYTIKDVKTGLVLGLADGRAVIDAEVVQQKASDAVTQKWYIYGDNNGGYYFANVGNASYVITTNAGGKNVLGIYGDDKVTPMKLPMESGDLEDGKYNIQSALKDKFVVTAESDKAVVSTLSIQKNNQNFQISFDKDAGYYKIADGQGRVLSLSASPVKAQLDLMFGDDKGECAQRFAFIKKSNGKYNIVSSCDMNFGFDVAYSKTVDGSAIIVFNKNGNKCQEWSFDLAKAAEEMPAPAPTPTPTPTPEPTPTPTPKPESKYKTIDDGQYVLLSALRNYYALDVFNASQNDGANIGAWTQNNGFAQTFEIKFDAEQDAYMLVNAHAGKALSFAGSKAAPNANIQINTINNSCNQYWRFIKKPNGKYNIVSACDMNYGIDVAYSRTIDGSNILLFNRNNNVCQEWSFELLKAAESTPAPEPTPAPTPTPTPAPEPTPTPAPEQKYKTIDDGKYTLLSALRSYYALDVQGASVNNGANIATWTQNNGFAQTFEMKYDSTRDAYRVTNIHANKALSFSGANAVPNANIQINTVADTCNQYWRFIKKPNGKYNIVSSCDMNYGIDVAYNRTIDGSNIVLFNRNNNTCQEWNLYKQ